MIDVDTVYPTLPPSTPLSRPLGRKSLISGEQNTIRGERLLSTHPYPGESRPLPGSGEHCGPPKGTGATASQLQPATIPPPHVTRDQATAHTRKHRILNRQSFMSEKPLVRPGYSVTSCALTIRVVPAPFFGGLGRGARLCGGSRKRRVMTRPGPSDAAGSGRLPVAAYTGPTYTGCRTPALAAARLYCLRPSAAPSRPAGRAASPRLGTPV